MTFKQDVAIEGTGVFGTFLRKELAPHFTIVDTANIVILAVPAAAYREMADKHQGKHLVNVCSVQEETTNICLEFTAMVTSIHPMFGPRSPADGRTCILTYQDQNGLSKQRDAEIQLVIDTFAKISSKIVTEFNGQPMTPRLHDEMMAKTHKQVVQISDHILQIVEDAKDIPDECLPTSFKRLRDMAEQFLDMPPGTRDSILSNKH
jgi:prephenate dehydrogenase